MKWPITLLMLAFISHSATTLYAQDFPVPKKYKLKKKEDYYRYEKDILKTIDWMNKTPLNESPKKWKKATGFFLEWITGCPQVAIELHEETVPFLEKNEILLIPFFAGWTKYALENPEEENLFVQGHLSGIQNAIAFYQKNLHQGIDEDPEMEKLIDLNEKNKLEDWIKEQLGLQKKSSKL